MSERQVLLSTPHGSHLYGLAHEDSDRDTYVVVANAERRRNRYAKQKINGDDDTFTVDLSTFLLMCEKGVPQALEAMYSTQATVDLMPALRASYRVSTAVLPTYLRTIKSFLAAGDEKRRRHAVRLALNAQEISQYGRFDPTLGEFERRMVMRYGGWDVEELEPVLNEWVLG